VVQELNDVADAIGELNQEYKYTGFRGEKDDDGTTVVKARTFGSDFTDAQDACDRNQCALACDAPADEGGK